MTLLRRRPSRKERGTLIIALMAGIAIVMILSTVAVQNWADVVRRDNEAEMMFRAQDLVRALKRYQVDKGRLPTDLKELMEPGQKAQYLLRRLWKDPLVKGGQWQLLYAAPGGGLFDPTVQQPPPQGGLQQSPSSGLTPSSSLGSSFGSTPGEAGGFPPLGSRDGDEGKAGALGGDPTGLPIAGVKSRCEDRPFRKYKEKTEYRDWVFSIFDLEQRQPVAAAPGSQNPPPGASFPPQGQPPPSQIPPPGQAPEPK